MIYSLDASLGECIHSGVMAVNSMTTLAMTDKQLCMPGCHHLATLKIFLATEAPTVQSKGGNQTSSPRHTMLSVSLFSLFI